MSKQLQQIQFSKKQFLGYDIDIKVSPRFETLTHNVY